MIETQQQAKLRIAMEKAGVKYAAAGAAYLKSLQAGDDETAWAANSLAEQFHDLQVDEWGFWEANLATEIGVGDRRRLVLRQPV